MSKRTDTITVRHNFRKFEMARDDEVASSVSPLLRLAGLIVVAGLLAGGYYAVLVVAGLFGFILLASGRFLDALAAWWAGVVELGRLTWEALLALAVVAGAVGLFWLMIANYR